MLEFQELRAFSAVAKNLNFSRAANEVGLSAPQFSKVIAGLEAKLKAKLLRRTTRSVRLTEEGKAFIVVANEAILSFQQAEQFFESTAKPHELVGRVRITAPNTLGTRFLGEPLTLYHQQFPKVELEIILNDHYLDFTVDEIDIALRVMKPEDTDLVAKKVADNRISFFASPSYLKQAGPVTSIEQLSQHALYAITPHLGLKFRKQKRTLKSLMKRNPVQSTNGDLLVEIARQGQGIVVRSDWGADKEVKAGQLVRLELDDELVSETGVYVVYPRNRHTPFRVRALIEILIQRFQESK